VDDGQYLMRAGLGLGFIDFTGLRKNARTWSFRGAGFAREPEIHEHRGEKSRAWPVFMGFGADPEAPSRSDGGVYPHLLAGGVGT
jgi:hypothetical protein